VSELEQACRLLGWNTRLRKDELLVEVCPFCGNPKYNFQISTTKGVYHAWCCNAKGSLRGLGRFFPLGDVAKHSRVKLPKEEAFGLTPEDTQQLQVFSKFKELIKLDSATRREVEGFLAGRGLTFDQAIGYKIRYCDQKILLDETREKRYNKVTYENRLIIPLFDISGNLVFFVGRALDKSNSTKYLNCGVKRKRFLPVYLGSTNPDTVLLVEGVFDALAAHQTGYSAIPLLSMDIGSPQLFSLLGIGFDRIVLSLDSGEVENSHMLYDKLSAVGLCPWMWLRDKGEPDLDLLSRSDVQARINSLLALDPKRIRDEALVGKCKQFFSKRRYDY